MKAFPTSPPSRMFLSGCIPVGYSRSGPWSTVGVENQRQGGGVAFWYVTFYLYDDSCFTMAKRADIVEGQNDNVVKASRCVISRTVSTQHEGSASLGRPSVRSIIDRNVCRAMLL